MLIRVPLPFICLLVASATISSCKHPVDDFTPVPSGTYPAEIGNIMVNRCATSGCHNILSYQNAGGLLLDAWSHLFDGGNNGSVIVPFSSANSPLLYFINTHEELGPVAVPTMPLNAPPLTQEEYLLIKNWVDKGAPDKDGIIPFSSNAATRQKIYATMQGCDQIAVIDAEKKVVMRYIPVGATSLTESPHAIRVDENGNYAYVSFTAGEYIQKIDTKTDTVVASLRVGTGSWNILHVSDDGTKIMLTNFNAISGQPTLVIIDAINMTIIDQLFIPSNEMSNPHGVASLPGFDVFFITRQIGNIVYKIKLSTGSIKAVSIDKNAPSTIPSHDPHEILMTPDYSKYFLTCQGSDEVRIMDVTADTLLKVINVGKVPQEIALSKTKPYMFVTCIDDATSVPGAKGSVYAINYNTYEITRIEGPFYQPHGITVDDQNGAFYVFSRNVATSGPPPHHSSSCSGRNGFYNAYDLNTFQRLPKRYEVLVDPYSADTRFK